MATTARRRDGDGPGSLDWWRHRLDGAAGGALASAGLAARGLLHLVVAILAVQLLAGGGGGEEPSGAGAVEALARQPGGRLLVGLVALGLLAYGLWRLAQAALGADEDDGPGRRLLTALRGVFHLGFAAAVAGIVAGGNSSGGGGEERSLTARVLEWPAGPVVVAGLGLVLLGVGVANLARAAKDDPADVLDDRRRPKGRAGAVVRGLSIAGLGARALAFGLVGWSFVAAAWSHEPGRADGVDDALRDLTMSAPGRVLLVVVAAGLAAHAGYLACQVVWRDERSTAGD